MSKDRDKVKSWRKYQKKRMRRGTPVLCVYCGTVLDPLTLTAEHVVPKSLGGNKLGRGNLVPACQPCNSKRGNGPQPSG